MHICPSPPESGQADPGPPGRFLCSQPGLPISRAGFISLAPVGGGILCGTPSSTHWMPEARPPQREQPRSSNSHQTPPGAGAGVTVTPGGLYCTAAPRVSQACGPLSGTIPDQGRTTANGSEEGSSSFTGFPFSLLLLLLSHCSLAMSAQMVSPTLYKLQIKNVACVWL